ncbi:MAG: phenylalanine--tRNA ligase subunit beta, partial [Candidatus Baumannia cicadellinicola]|nr:phenylalanine--tRNA ligase subunit beta [Candidatus Baumannia cicadellinicola]
MKFSELWLREWVNPTIDSNALAEQMTMFGLEVNSIDAVANNYADVVVGQIVECDYHPNNEQLLIVKVNINKSNLININCNDVSCRKTLKVAVHIVESDDKLLQGKLCSFAELGIRDYYHNIGIIELPIDAPIGDNLSNYLKLYDKIFDFSVTPNRADCLGIVGIAREIAIINKLPLKRFFTQSVAPLIINILPINVIDSIACPRYIGRVIKNINSRMNTPLWIKEKLRRSGISLVNVVIDITNYILLEFGQPINVFDLNKINGGLIIRRAKPKEKITLLNGYKATLTSETLVVADHSKVLSIAGIIGGIDSSFTCASSHIFLEAAFFNPLVIRGQARKYGVNTEASLRYERGIDPMLTLHVIERATSLILDICGGQPGPVINVTNTAALPKPATIILRRKKLDSLIGYIIPDQEIIDILSRIGCKITNITHGWQILTPHWRFDIETEENIIEEITRIYGYDKIPHVPIRSNLLIQQSHKETILPLERAKYLLVDRGYYEAITYSFVDPKIQKLLYPGHVMLHLRNPLSLEMSAMRLSMLPGLICAVIYNNNRQQKNIRLFESGSCFIPSKNVDEGIRQNLLLSGVKTGCRFDEHWSTKHQQADFYDIKGDIEAILELTGKLDQIEFKAQEQSVLHPGQCA